MTADELWSVLEPLGWKRIDVPTEHIPERWTPMSDITGHPSPAYDTVPRAKFTHPKLRMSHEITADADGNVHVRSVVLSWQYEYWAPVFSAIGSLLNPT